MRLSPVTAVSAYKVNRNKNNNTSFKQLRIEEDTIKNVSISKQDKEKLDRAIPDAIARLSEYNFVNAFLFGSDEGKVKIAVFRPENTYSVQDDITKVVQNSTSPEELSERIYNRTMELAINSEYSERKTSAYEDDDDYDGDSDTGHWDLTDAYIP